MKKMFIIVLALIYNLATISTSLDWVKHAKFKDFNKYFPNLMQHLIYEIEDYGWWNLRLRDQSDSIDQIIYDRHFKGTVNYTNGFVVGNEEMEIYNYVASFMQGSATYATTGSMRTTLKFYNMKIGYDVHAQLDGLGEHTFTGVFNHPEVHFEIAVTKNYNTSVIVPECKLTNLGAGKGNYMQYLPHSDIAEVLQRHYKPVNAWDGVEDWCLNVISPAVLKLVSESQLGFPEICFNCE